MEVTVLNAALKWLEIYKNQPIFSAATEDEAYIADLWAAAEVIARKKYEEELKFYMKSAIEAETALDEFTDAIAKALETARINDFRRSDYGEKNDQRKSEGETVSRPSGDMSHLWG